MTLHDKRLSTYLNDHLAGATGGLELVKRTASSNEGTPYEEGDGPHSVTVAGFEVQYTRDDVARVLTLQRVTRARQRDLEEIA